MPRKSASETAPADRAAQDVRAEAETAAFAEALRRIRDTRHRACIRWFVLELANGA